jgi:signal transduction histidine kinase
MMGRWVEAYGMDLLAWAFMAEPDFQALFESAPGLYLVLDPTLTIIAVSNSYLAATMTERSIVGKKLFDVFPDNPDDPHATGTSNLRDSLGRVLSAKRPDTMAVQKYDIRRPESAGGGFEVRHWSPVNSPVLDDHGELRYIIHRVEDVSEFVRLKEQGSRQSEVTEALRGKTAQMEAEILRRAQDIQIANAELRTLQQDLERRVEERTTDLVRANEELAREVEERKQAERVLAQTEAHLRQAQKLEAVGRLAGGIAHDFNNILSVVLSYSSLLLASDTLDEATKTDIGEIKLAGERAAELTRQMLAFSRQQVLDLKILDPNEVLTTLTKMLQRVLGEDIDLRLVLAPHLARIKADRSQFEQVVMNLVVNARDAMPKGGHLTIETSNVELDAQYTTKHIGVTNGPHVMIAVSDTGFGMDQDTQARAFEPFFTTKERNKGTGLGLATVFGIVKQLSGSIWLYSEVGIGTTFRIYLPRADGEVYVATGPSLPLPLAKPGEVVLLVEDEGQVRAVAQGILQKVGYAVHSVATPLEALAFLEAHPERIDLLITDVVMPKMNGRELADRVKQSGRDLKVLFVSGYTDNVIIHHGVLDTEAAFLQKPLTPESLAHKVRAVLDAPSH